MTTYYRDTVELWPQSHLMMSYNVTQDGKHNKFSERQALKYNYKNTPTDIWYSDYKLEGASYRYNMTIVFNNCCGCIELRKGCFIIAYVNLIFGIISFIGLSVFGIASITALKDSKSESIPDTAITIYTVIIVLAMILLILQLIFIIILLVGLHQNKRKHLNAYVKFNIGFLVVYLMFNVVYSTQYALDVGQLVVEIISFLVNIYFLLVIRSYYLQMVEEKNEAQVNYTTSRPANA